jgi:SAM-dependent methyltransferase
MERAVDRWARGLAEWEIPAHLLAAVPWNPYEWALPLWRRRTESAKDERPSPTLQVVLDLAGQDSDVLDVGAGAGRYSLALARAGRRVTAVEPDDGMRAALVDLAGSLPVDVVPGGWPETAAVVGAHAVVLCANVVYNVASIGPFLAALVEKAARGVVIELTASHPWVHFGPYYRTLHGLERPSGPQTADLLAVIDEELGVQAHVASWARPPDVMFESMDELVEYYARRLVLPRPRWPELNDLLRPEAELVHGRWQVGPPERAFATVWWSTSNSTG